MGGGGPGRAGKQLSDFPERPSIGVDKRYSFGGAGLTRGVRGSAARPSALCMSAPRRLSTGRATRPRPLTRAAAPCRALTRRTARQRPPHDKATLREQRKSRRRKCSETKPSTKSGKTTKGKTDGRGKRKGEKDQNALRR